MNTPDYIKLSKFMLVFGFVLVCIGGIKLFSNLPLSAQVPTISANSPAAMASFVDQIGNNVGIETQNDERSYNREKAFKAVGFGVVTIFAAIAIMKSTRKPNA